MSLLLAPMAPSARRREKKNRIIWTSSSTRMLQQASAVGLVMPQANTEAMAHHLQALSEAVPAGRHAVLVLDQAGWHTQTAAVPQRFIVAAASGLARAQPHRADVAATARPASGKPLLRRLRANSRRLLRGLECLYTNSRRHPLFMLTKLGNTAFGFG